MHDAQRHAGGQRRAGSRRPWLRICVGDGGRAEAGGLEDVDADGLFVVVRGERTRLFGRVADVGQIAEPDDAALVLRDDELLEVGRRIEPALQPDRALVELPFEPADRRRQVLRLQRLNDLRDADARGLQVARPDLHDQLALDRANEVNGGHAGNATQPPRDVRVGDARQLGAGQTRRRQRQRHDRPVGGIELREDRLLHLRRQLVANLGDLVADLLRRQPRVLREVELDDDVREAVERVRRHLVDAADAGDHLFDRIDDFSLDDVRRRAGIRDRDHDDRRVDLRILVGVELHQRHQPEDHEQQHRDDGQDRAFDGGI